MIRERALPCTTEMVEALLLEPHPLRPEVPKTETRRVVNPQPRWRPESYINVPGWVWDFAGTEYEIGGKSDFWRTEAPNLCPYGQPGDRLWVKESFRVAVRSLRTGDDRAFVQYKAGAGDAWCDVPEDKDGMPSAQVRASYLSGRFMPRWAARIFLEIVEVRIEQLQDITWRGARAEGVDKFYADSQGGHEGAYVGEFVKLWDRINAGRGYGWDRNPWVWVVRFRLIGGATR